MGMPHAQARMTALLRIPVRPAESLDEKIAQPLLGGIEIIRRIQRAEHIVSFHPPIEIADQCSKSRLTKKVKNLCFGCHYNNRKTCGPKTNNPIATEPIALNSTAPAATSLLLATIG